MTVSIHLPAVLRADADGRAELEVPAAPDLGSLLDQVAADWPRLARRIRDEQGVLRRFVNVYVDGEDCRATGGLSTPIPDGGEVLILPSVAGG